jgi:hypothetical protein
MRNFCCFLLNPELQELVIAQKEKSKAKSQRRLVMAKDKEEKPQKKDSDSPPIKPPPNRR